MSRLISYILILITQIPLVIHDITIFTWEWWVIHVCIILYSFFVNEEN